MTKYPKYQELFKVLDTGRISFIEEYDSENLIIGGSFEYVDSNNNDDKVNKCYNLIKYNKEQDSYEDIALFSVNIISTYYFQTCNPCWV